jgi:hypothetical protein
VYQFQLNDGTHLYPPLHHHADEENGPGVEAATRPSRLPPQVHRGPHLRPGLAPHNRPSHQFR